MGRPASGVLVSGLDPALAELALAHGVATHFSDWRGGNVEISAAAVTGVLNALGVDVSSADAVQHALAEAREATWRRMMPPYLVIRGGSQAKVAVHVVHGATVSVRVDLEDGGQRDLEQLMDWVDPRQVDEVLVGEATFAIPDDVALGYHTLVSVSGERHERSPLIVVPDRLGTPDGRAWGFMLQLYAARSVSSWGMGDLHDLAKLATWSAHELGADFVLVNPLHAVAPVPPIEPSPYYPASRRFVNPLYLRVEDVDEVRALPMTTVEA
ncbi:MAG: 4-alpha-glucanotransferase, partial [Actinomycetota bacterium]|nr:4-alpha-glucanotransferase [Actinomycetota bacterium]